MVTDGRKISSAYSVMPFRAVMLARQCLRSTDPRKADQKKVFLYQRSIRETSRLLKVNARYFPFYRTFAFNARVLN